MVASVLTAIRERSWLQLQCVTRTPWQHFLESADGAADTASIETKRRGRSANGVMPVCERLMKVAVSL